MTPQHRLDAEARSWTRTTAASRRSRTRGSALVNHPARRFKVHIAVGVKTHVVTAAAIYERDANDCPILPELVKGTAERFTVKEVSADKAYLSAENVETVELRPWNETTERSSLW